MQEPETVRYSSNPSSEKWCVSAQLRPQLCRADVTAGLQIAWSEVLKDLRNILSKESCVVTSQIPPERKRNVKKLSMFPP